MTHLFDTSVWHKFARFSAVRDAVEELNAGGAVFATCPPVVAEYCFSARNSSELNELQEDMDELLKLESSDVARQVELIQSALWAQGYVRAAGAMDTLVAAYAIKSKSVLVTCDKGHARIAQALSSYATRVKLSVLLIQENGEVLTT